MPDIEELKALYAATDERHDPAACPVPAERLRSGRGIEVGQIFYLGTKYSKPLGATVMGRTARRPRSRWAATGSASRVWSAP